MVWQHPEWELGRGQGSRMPARASPQPPAVQAAPPVGGDRDVGMRDGGRGAGGGGDSRADDVRVVVAKLQEQNGCLIAVRGSENIQNWIDDFEAWEVSPSAFNETCEGGCKVHGGYVVFSFLYIFRLITLND